MLGSGHWIYDVLFLNFCVACSTERRRNLQMGSYTNHIFMELCLILLLPLIGAPLGSGHGASCPLGSPESKFILPGFLEDQLKDLVNEIRSTTPNIGQQRLVGALRSRNIHVQRRRVRRCLRELDPLETALRWRSAIFRRKYSVPGPNALWHIDGNHKLICYRLVIHVCVDGFSRLLVYAHCACNNRAETVMEQFLIGVQTYGLPS